MHLTHASTYCSDAYSCEFSEKISPSICSGYYSCAYSKLMERYSIDCSGSFSCYGISIINMTEKNFALTCQGLYSCANVSNIGHYPQEWVYNGYFDCNGELSCFGSTFTNVTNSMTLLCAGDRSCANSNVTLNGGIIGVFGYLGAANSTIKIGDSSSKVEFIGMESGKNTTIICSGSDTTCQIQCYNNACDELRLIYDTDNNNNNNNSNNSNGNQFVVDCLNAFKSDACPDGFDFETQLIDFLSVVYPDDWYNETIRILSNFSMPIIPSLYQNITTSYTNLNNSVNACAIETNMSSIIVYEELLNNSDSEYDYVINTGLNNEYPINCMDASECQGNILNTTDFVDVNIDSITVPICCTAEYSCYGSNNLKNTINYNYNQVSSSIGIRCDGYGSCSDLTNGTYMASNGNIFVSAGSNGDYIMKININGKNSNSSELFCNGRETCQVSAGLQSTDHEGDPEERKIENFKNIFCNGDNSCENSVQSLILTFENIGNSVFFYGGNSGGSNMKFNNIGNSVYCVGVSAGGCSYSIFNNIMGSVYGIGVGSIEHSTINNVTNVYGINFYSMQYNIISNVENNVYFVGDGAGEDSTIRNAQNVKCVSFFLFCFVFCVQGWNQQLFLGYSLTKNYLVTLQSIIYR